MRWRWSVSVLWIASTLALAQEVPQPPATPQPPPAQPHEDRLHAELRREGERVSDACKDFTFNAMPGCAYEFFTDHPLHIAAGSLPPQNGFGLGGAFVRDKNPKNWRLTWDVDAVGATSGSWRAGAYMKMIHNPHTPEHKIHVTFPTAGEQSKEDEKPTEATKAQGPKRFTHPYAVFNLYVQAISLNKLNFFGLGNDKTLAGASVFGMTETILGGSAIKPVYEWPALRKLNLTLLGEVNGRFVDIRGEHGQSVPSIETPYTNTTAPGLSNQPGFAQLGEGFRVTPAFGDFHFNYTGKFQQFFAPSNSQYSFLRWTADLDHVYYLHGFTPAGTDISGPDECTSPPTEKCPPITHTKNLNGSIELRLLVSESITSGTSTVPFYFQQTLGGSDINSALALGSYQDYRFRAPNLLLLQENIEHSIWGPFGAKFMADQGRVALTRGDLGFSHMKHSFAGGLTLRAGAFPMVSLMFAWGGPEGHHNIGNVNTSLLGGSPRPPLD
jgi:hypothetical protein